MIELKAITKDYHDGNQLVNLLKPTSFTINPKEFIAITGPSGSGKSTLLTIIGALQKPTSGTLLIDHQDVYRMNEKQRSMLRLKDIGFVLQGSNLVPYLTLQEQYELKLKQAKIKDQMHIETILISLGIEKIRNKYPDNISGGERQRAAIGLALLLQPKIILADEPTASLDTQKANEVASLLQKISRDFSTSVIMVTHDRRLLHYCDRILEMNDGCLSESESKTVSPS